MKFAPIDYVAAIVAAVMILGPLAMAPAYADHSQSLQTQRGVSSPR